MFYVMYFENFIDLGSNFELIREFVNTNVYTPYDSNYCRETSVYIRKGTLEIGKSQNYIKTGIAPMQTLQPIS
jgi:hypothetical protein